MSRKYFRYLLSSSKIQLVFFLIMTVALMTVPFVTTQSTEPYRMTFFDSAGLGLVATGLITLVDPVMQLSYVHRKRSADMIYALPITRKEQIVTIEVYTWLRAALYYTLGSAVAFALCHGQVSVLEFVQMLLIAFLGLAVFTLLHSWLFLLANNIFDGIVMIVAYAVFPLMIYLTILTVGETMIAGFSWNQLTSTKVLDIISPYTTLANLADGLCRNHVLEKHCILGLLGYGLIAMVGLNYEGVKRKAERAEQVSDRFLSYPFVINAYALTCLLMLGAFCARGGIRENVIWYLLLFLAYVVSSFVYRRKIQLDYKYIAAFIGTAILSVILFKGVWINHAFGISEKYDLQKGDTLSYQYYMYEYADLVESPESVDFSLDIPTDRLQEYKDVIDIMESKRKQAITNFYLEKDNVNYNCTLRVNSIQGKEVPLTYYYNEAIKLTGDELAVVAKYTEVEIGYHGEIMPYNDYLKCKGD